MFAVTLHSRLTAVAVVLVLGIPGLAWSQTLASPAVCKQKYRECLVQKDAADLAGRAQCLGQYETCYKPAQQTIQQKAASPAIAAKTATPTR